MKITMQQPIHQYRKAIAEHENKNKDYARSQRVQQTLNQLGNSQIRKVPNHLCPLTLLYATGILSNFYLGKNTPEKMPINSTKSDALPLQSAVQHAISVVYQTAIEKAGNFHLYDPLVFPGADAAFPQQGLKVSWFRPHSAAFVPYNPSFTPPVTTNEVTIEKIDFSCIEERAELSISNVLRKIAQTLQRPATEMTRETQILTHYAQQRPCPTDEEVKKVTEVTDDIDRIISQMADWFPQFTEIQIIQRIISPLLNMIADDMENKTIAEADIEELDENILSFSKSIVDSVIHNENNFPTGDKLKIPNGVSVKNRTFQVKIENNDYPVIYNSDGFFINQNGHMRMIKYHENDQSWRFYDEELKQQYQKDGDPFYTQCTLRHKRGINLGKLCSDSFDEHHGSAHFSGDPNYQVTRSSNSLISSLSYSTRHKELINHLSIGLEDTSPRVDKIKFADTWEMYRVRKEDGISSGYYHAIKMNGKLVPVRSTLIVDNHIRCEVYDLRQSQSGYSVVHHAGNWWFERSTSIHVDKSLKENIMPNMFRRSIDELHLSTPDNHGLKRDADGNTYLKIHQKFAKIEDPHNEPRIISHAGDIFYLRYGENKYHFTNAVLNKGYLKVTEEQFRMDKRLNSADGLDFTYPRELNDNWRLLNINVKSTRLIEDLTVGSKIDVAIRIKYTGDHLHEFIEPPVLQWMEKIRHKDGNQLWQFSSDMYTHNRNSLTFFPWNHKYLEAYHFCRIAEKNEFNSLVKIYDREMKPLQPKDISYWLSDEDKIDAVKTYLKDNGGILEVVIADVPQIRVNNINSNKERVINFDIGFNDQAVASFSQGISLSESQFENIFVTTSTDINLAQGEVNTFPPQTVARKRTLKRR